MAQLIIEARSHDYKGGNCCKNSPLVFYLIGVYLERELELILSSQNSDQNIPTLKCLVCTLHKRQQHLFSWVCSLQMVGTMCLVSNCDRACKNRACGHKLHFVVLQVISHDQYWNRIFAFCNLHHKCLLRTENCIAMAFW